MTIREMIDELEKIAAREGDDMKVKIYDSYEANEGWGEYDVWCDPDITVSDNQVCIECEC